MKKENFWPLEKSVLKYPQPSDRSFVIHFFFPVDFGFFEGDRLLNHTTIDFVNQYETFAETKTNQIELYCKLNRKSLKNLNMKVNEKSMSLKSSKFLGFSRFKLNYCWYFSNVFYKEQNQLWASKFLKIWSSCRKLSWCDGLKWIAFLKAAQKSELKKGITCKTIFST